MKPMHKEKSVNMASTHPSASLVVVQVHEAPSLILRPSTIILLPLSNVNKSLSESAIHNAPFSLKVLHEN
jgi:hypothetical protein